MNYYINLPFILFVYLYRKSLSYIIGRDCRYYPTCSHYALICLVNQSLPLAIWKASYRVLRCNPYSSGFKDFPFPDGDERNELRFNQYDFPLPFRRVSEQ